MKKIMISAILTLSFMGSIQFAYAEDASKMMDMNGMKSMMNDCMTMNKDGKMCSQETMTKCEEKMGQADCAKMMKKMKSAKMNSNMNTK